MTYTITEPVQGTVLINAQGPGTQLQSQVGLQFTGGHLISGGPAVTATGNANATVNQLRGNDVAGILFMSTNASASAGVQALVTFATAFASIPFIMVTPASGSLGALQAVGSQGGFAINAFVAPPSSASVAYSYLVVG